MKTKITGEDSAYHKILIELEDGTRIRLTEEYNFNGNLVLRIAGENTPIIQPHTSNVIYVRENKKERLDFNLVLIFGAAPKH